MAKLRPLGKITDDMEYLLEEMVDTHELQAQEVLYLVFSWIQAHRPGCIPEYVDPGSGLTIYIGPNK